MTVEPGKSDTDGLFRKAAERALYDWHKQQWDRQKDDLDDLVNDLWVWYLESPAVQKMVSEGSCWSAVKRHAIQILAEQAQSRDAFDGKKLYSADSVKDVLKGRSRNRYLKSILGLAWERVEARNPVYSTALTQRYINGQVPASRTAAQLSLYYAVTALTEEVNLIYLTENPGAIPPGLRRRKGDQTDPTASVALGLLKGSPEAYEYLRETPLLAQIKGAKATLVMKLGDGRRYRATPYESYRIRSEAGYSLTVLDIVRARAG